MTLLELKYIITSARNAAAIAKGMVELRSIVFYSRGPRCLRCFKLRMVGALGGLMMTPRRSSGRGACIPELTTRRHRGPLLCLGSRAKASTLQGRHRRFTGGSAFHMSFRGLLSLWATQQKWYHHLATDDIGVPSKLHVEHTHTRTVTELVTYEVLLYSSLYLFEYCCLFHPNSGTVHPDIVHRKRKRAPLTQSTIREEFVEKSAR